jgi:hypothetical protein
VRHHAQTARQVLQHDVRHHAQTVLQVQMPLQKYCITCCSLIYVSSYAIFSGNFNLLSLFASNKKLYCYLIYCLVAAGSGKVNRAAQKSGRAVVFLLTTSLAAAPRGMLDFFFNCGIFFLSDFRKRCRRVSEKVHGGTQISFLKDNKIIVF